MALHAVLDIDEFIFESMTPIKMHHGIQQLQPIQISCSRRRSQLESLVHFVSLISLISLAYLLLLVPLGDNMLKLKNELCGGTQTFVVRYNSDSQIPYGFSTSVSRESGNLTASELAVYSHKATSPETTPGLSGATPGCFTLVFACHL